MWCTDNYNISCAIDSIDPSQCANKSSICNPTQPTVAPSLSLTKALTVTSTDIPSSTPSNYPTQHPTVHPSQNPSSVPSVAPTRPNYKSIPNSKCISNSIANCNIFSDYKSFRFTNENS